MTALAIAACFAAVYAVLGILPDRIAEAPIFDWLGLGDDA